MEGCICRLRDRYDGFFSFPDEYASPTRAYPVLVFVHGESFSWGSGNVYDGRVLASYARAIVVTFNYRLGVFGNIDQAISFI